MWHFWVAMPMGYGLSTVGILGGVRLVDAHAGRTLWAFKVALPVMFGVACVWEVIRGIGSGLFRTSGETATTALVFGFIAVGAAIIGVVWLFSGGRRTPQARNDSHQSPQAQTLQSCGPG